jgi:hypothetical protein
MILFTVDPYLLNIPLRIEAPTAIMTSIWNIVSRTTTPESIFNSYLEKWQAIISVRESFSFHFHVICSIASYMTIMFFKNF